MTKEQIDILNETICNLKTLCKGRQCTNCHMALNCGKSPAEWELIGYDGLVGEWGEDDD